MSVVKTSPKRGKKRVGLIPRPPQTAVCCQSIPGLARHIGSFPRTERQAPHRIWTPSYRRPRLTYARPWSQPISLAASGKIQTHNESAVWSLCVFPGVPTRARSNGAVCCRPCLNSSTRRQIKSPTAEYVHAQRVHDLARAIAASLGSRSDLRLRKLLVKPRLERFQSMWKRSGARPAMARRRLDAAREP
jgi:hypothetical protein